MVKNRLYAIVDVETTGLFPEKYDRLLEIAIITMNSNFEIVTEYETLINPNRDVGATHIHRITPKMLLDAPTFEMVAGDIANHLSGKYIVGHNVSFDFRFLQSEFERVGVQINQPNKICTLNLSKRLDRNIPSRRLECLCSYFDIPLENKHSAYFDCKATAELFKYFLNVYGEVQVLTGVEQSLTIECKLPLTSIQFKRTHYEEKLEKDFISSIIRRLPTVSDVNQGVDEYLSCLDKVVSDKVITYEEADLLYEIAIKNFIDRDKALTIHRQYLSQIIRITLIDGIISDKEFAEITKIAELLNIPQGETNLLIEKEKASLPTKVPNDKFYVGKSICFTGAFAKASRDDAQRTATEYGLQVKKGVVKGLDFLVASDTDNWFLRYYG